MVKRRTVTTAGDYARALLPHLEHESYRCDQPHHRLMGKGCRTCQEEIFISTDDFRANGDLEAFDRVMKHPEDPKEK
jgi:hypothetical protein